MNQPRRYKDIPSLKITPEKQAEHDYHRTDEGYNNPYAKQDRRWMAYYLAFYEFVAMEQVELNAEVQGN